MIVATGNNVNGMGQLTMAQRTEIVRRRAALLSGYMGDVGVHRRARGGAFSRLATRARAKVVRAVAKVQELEDVGASGGRQRRARGRLVRAVERVQELEGATVAGEVVSAIQGVPGGVCPPGCLVPALSGGLGHLGIGETEKALLLGVLGVAAGTFIGTKLSSSPAGRSLTQAAATAAGAEVPPVAPRRPPVSKATRNTLLIGGGVLAAGVAALAFLR